MHEQVNSDVPFLTRSIACFLSQGNNRKNRGADKFLARPGRKQASRREQLSSFLFPARQGAEGKSRYSGRNSLFPSWSG